MYPVMSSSKSSYYKRLCESLGEFYPDRAGQFLCPTCYRFFLKNEIDSYGQPRSTKAHLIPKAAGGREFTYACKDCNSKFGAAQDKWLGEYIHIIKSGGNPLNGPTKPRRFSLNDCQLNGEIQIGEDQAMEVYVYTNRNSPKNISAMLQETKHPHYMDVTIPIDKHMHEVRVGALTTAYLSCFYHLGYSWVIQRHLDPIRNQILNPDVELLPSSFCTLFKDELWEFPWIGFLEINNILCIGYGYLNFLVLFPPADQEEFYEQVEIPIYERDFGGTVILPLAKSQSPPCFAMFFEHRLIISPDVIKRDRITTDIIHFPKREHPPVLLTSYPIKKLEPYLQGKRDHSDKRVSINNPVK